MKSNIKRSSVCGGTTEMAARKPRFSAVCGLAVFTLVFSLALAGCGGDDEPPEPAGSSAKSAIDLTIGQWANGKLEKDDSIVWYKFEAKSNKSYILTSDSARGSGNYTAAIEFNAYKSDQQSIINNIQEIRDGYTKPRIINNYSGTVYIRVKATWGYATVTGSFVIKVSEGDSNDTKETATALTPNAWTTNSEIDPEGDVDWYKFQAVAGQSYTLAMDREIYGSGNMTCRTYVSVFKSDGITAYKDANNTDILDENDVYSQQKQKTFTATAAEIVYIRVTADSYYNTTGTYAIKVSGTFGTLPADPDPGTNPGGGTPPTKLTTAATAAQAKAKLQEIVNYPGTSDAVKRIAQNGINQWDEGYTANWNNVKADVIAMINDMIDNISDPNYGDDPGGEHGGPDLPAPAGKLTVTGLSAYNGKYISAQGSLSESVLLQGISQNWESVLISGGQAVIPLYKMILSGEVLTGTEAYTGSDSSVSITLLIFTSATGEGTPEHRSVTVSFSGGSATAAWAAQ
jgi:hypothetical protein